MGKMHAKIYKKFPDVTLVGIVGRNVSKTMVEANSLETKAYTNPYDLINNDEVEVIDVCYPTAIHAEYVISALNRGKHVLCETPLAYKIEEAEEMLNAAKLNNRLLLVALYDRFQNITNFIDDEQLRDGESL